MWGKNKKFLTRRGIRGTCQWGQVNQQTIRHLLTIDNHEASSSTQKKNNEMQSGNTNGINVTKKVNPPPIFVQSVNSYKGMLENIAKIIPKDQAMANDGVKISVTEIDSYHKLVKEFRERGILFLYLTN